MKKKVLITFLALVIIGIVALGIIQFNRTLVSGRIDKIILISLDTTRADYLSCYGCPNQITPNIDAIALEGVLFENVVSPVPLTLPSHGSMLTGTIPPYHGVHDNLDYILNESNITLAEILKESAFKTAAVVSAFVMDSKFGLSQGFDYYNDKFGNKYMAGPDISERKGHETSRLAIEWLEKNKDEQFFLFLHYFDPHFIYDPPEPFASRFASDPYAGEIAYTDYCIGLVIQKLKDMNLYDSTLIIITADHGEMLDEHGEPAHGYFIYESAIKVPLIFKLPGHNKPLRIKPIAGLIDIVPTVCSLLKIEIPEDIQGIDLSAYFKGKKSSSKDRHLYCESVLPTRYSANSLLGVVNSRYKYIQTTRPELYDLLQDSKEVNNLIDAEPRRARILRDKLEQILEHSVQTLKQGSKIELDAVSRKRLESLGYVGGWVDDKLEFDQTKKDPKDTIKLYIDEQEILTLKFLKKYDQARLLCEKLLGQYPDFLAGYRHLAEIAFERNDFGLAVAHFSKLIELDPNNSQVYSDRGFAYNNMGKYDLAIQDFNNAINLNPNNPDFHNNRALACKNMGRYNQAIRSFDDAIKLDPSNADLYNGKALSYLAKKDYYKAVQDFSQAIELNPASAILYNNRGLAYRTYGFYGMAIEDFGQAIKLDKLNPTFHNNMGLTLGLQGKPEEAVSYFRQSLHLRRDWPDALNNLAWILATHEDIKVRNASEAVDLARRACELTNYKAPTLLDTLAAALASNGQFEEAIRNAEKALKICRENNIIPLAEEIQSRLDLFKQNKAYHQ